jgi:dTDP-4-dehydrorhamnose reductase
VTLLVTGASGQVGGALVALSNKRGIEILAPARAQLDLADTKSISAYLSAHKFSAIINCAAYTAVDKAEDDADLAIAINAKAPDLLAQISAERGVPLLHVSTDYVFDGAKLTPYLEEDPTNPLSIYGASKLAGEQAIMAAGGKFVILRTAWVVSASGANFINTMLRLAETRDSLSVVNDQIGCPTNADDIAAALLMMQGAQAQGLYHFVNGGTASWYDLAAHIFARAAEDGHKVPQLHSIPTSAYPTRAVRPAHSVLDTSKFVRDFATPPRDWQAAINAVLDTRLT